MKAFIITILALYGFCAVVSLCRLANPGRWPARRTVVELIVELAISGWAIALLAGGGAS